MVGACGWVSACASGAGGNVEVGALGGSASGGGLVSDGGLASGYGGVLVGIASAVGLDVVLGYVRGVPTVCNSNCLSSWNCKAPAVAEACGKDYGTCYGAGGGG